QLDAVAREYLAITLGNGVEVAAFRAAAHSECVGWGRLDEMQRSPNEECTHEKGWADCLDKRQEGDIAEFRRYPPGKPAVRSTHVRALGGDLRSSCLTAFTVPSVRPTAANAGRTRAFT